MMRSWLTTLIFILAGCSNIEGTYVSNVSCGRDTLKIFDHHYYRIFYDSNKINSVICVDTGSYVVYGDDIYFRNWIEECSEWEDPSDKEPIMWGAPINKKIFSGETNLMIDEDMDYYYYKINAANSEKQLK